MDNTTKMAFDLSDDTDRIVLDEALFDDVPTIDMRFDVDESEQRNE